MDIMAEKKVGIDVLAAPLHRVPQEYVFVRITDKRAVVADEDVKAVVSRISEELGQSGRLIFRYSDTENLVRIMVEASTEKQCKAYVDEIIGVIRSKGYYL